MSKIAAAVGFGLGFALISGLVIVVPAPAQDIAGIEDCTKTSGLDKRTGCLQSNVNFLQQLLTKSTLDARQRLNAANGEIAALRNEIVTLKGTVASLQASVEQLRAAQKAQPPKAPDSKAPDKKPEAK
jgi:chromosome segregation ATPase